MKLQSTAALAVLAAMLASTALAASPRFIVAAVNPDLEPRPSSVQVDGTWFNVAARNGLGDMAGNVHVPPLGYHIVGTGIDVHGQPFEDRFFASSRAAILNDGHLTVLGTMGRAESFGVAINAQGQVAGNAATHITRVTNGGATSKDFRALTPSDSRAFLYENGQMNDLGTLGGSSSQAMAINARGDVLGHSNTTGDQKSEAFLYRDGQMTSLGVAEGLGSQAIALNDEGDVAGAIHFADGVQAFVHQDGVTQVLGTLGGRWSSASALSSRGVVAGNVAFQPGHQHSFVHVDGRSSLLPTLGTTVTGFEHMSVTGVNDQGDVIGTTLIGEYERVPFLYTGGQIYDFRTLVDADTEAIGDLLEIRDDGSILAAFGSGNILFSRATAVPEPGSWMLMLLGVAMIAGLRARRCGQG